MNRETEAEESLGLEESFHFRLFYDMLEDIQITFDGTGNLKFSEKDRRDCSPSDALTVFPVSLTITQTKNIFYILKSNCNSNKNYPVKSNDKSNKKGFIIGFFVRVFLTLTKDSRGGCF